VGNIRVSPTTWATLSYSPAIRARLSVDHMSRRIRQFFIFKDLEKLMINQIQNLKKIIKKSSKNMNLLEWRCEMLRTRFVIVIS
jgi:hypothetical protein